MSSSKRTAWIFLCKAPPTRGGGGLGVAYNYLRSIHGSSPGGPVVDAYLICGTQVTQLPDTSGRTFEEFHLGMLRATGLRLVTFARQAAIIGRLSKGYDRVVILGFSPYYLWKLIRHHVGCEVVCIHSEHGKGGRHNELAQESGKFGLKERLIQTAVSWNFAHADHVVFPSAGSVELFVSMNPGLAVVTRSKAVVIHNGVERVDDSVEPLSPPGRFRIISIAHHVREKGLHDVLQALASPPLKNIPWDFENIGATSGITQELRSQADESGIAPQVTFSGLIPAGQVRSRLAGATAFLHLPKIVVFDLSLLEAMMYGVPVVTNPLPGNVEALGEDYPLYCTDPEGAAAHLAWLHRHPNEAAAIGGKLKRRASGIFTNEAMAGRYNEFLRTLSV